jgi:hypothetical protein
MKTIKILLTITIIVTLFAFSQCKKNKTEPQLPPETTTGAMTFGCKVNGEVWVPYYKCGGTSNPCGEIFVDIARTSQNQLPVEISIGPGLKYENNSQSFFTISSPTNNGIFTIGNKIDSIGFKYVKPGSIEYVEIPGMDSNNKFIITKLDAVNKIISGSFTATLYKSLTDSVKITEGRFDLKFAVCKCSN